MSIKIAHVSDIHVRKLKYHKEYRAVFEQLYEKLREEKPDIIVNTGDTFHTTVQIQRDILYDILAFAREYRKRAQF